MQQFPFKLKPRVSPAEDKTGTLTDWVTPQLTWATWPCRSSNGLHWLSRHWSSQWSQRTQHIQTTGSANWTQTTVQHHLWALSPNASHEWPGPACQCMPSSGPASALPALCPAPYTKSSCEAPLQGFSLSLASAFLPLPSWLQENNEFPTPRASRINLTPSQQDQCLLTARALAALNETLLLMLSVDSSYNFSL